MEDSTIFIIVISIFALSLAGVGIYFLLRFLRGKITLSLPITSFNPGDTIKGSFELHAKKPISGKRLVVSLIGTRHERSRQKDGKSSSHSHEIFRQEVLVEEAREYPGGFKEVYNFELPIPASDRPEFMNNNLLQTLATAANFIGNRRVEVRWRLEARLQAKGIDLAGSRRVTLNTSAL